MLVVGAMLLGGAAAVDVRPPPPPPRLELVDPNSDAFQKALADEIRSAREATLHSKPPVVRTFLVGSELHYGYYLISPDKLDELITPDLLDQRVRDIFDANMHPDVMMKHMGERLQCECSGIPWDFSGGQRFIVQSAALRWIK